MVWTSISINAKYYVYFDYTFSNVSIELVESFTDLGTMFDSKLRFNKHIVKITNKAFQNLGFIIQTYKFKKIIALKSIYFAFVRSQLEYASLNWSSNNIGVTHNLDAVQNRFLRFLALKFKTDRPQHDYSFVLKLLNNSINYIILFNNINLININILIY